MKTYIKLPVALLDVPIETPLFKQFDESDVVTYLTIREYIKTANHTVSTISSDDFFIKGFGADLLAEVYASLDGCGVEFKLMNIDEVRDEMKKPQWQTQVTAD